MRLSSRTGLGPINRLRAGADRTYVGHSGRRDGGATPQEERTLSRFTLLMTSAAVMVTAGIAAIPANAQTPGCTPRSNIEAIIDDSGSMDFNDFERLRNQGMGLFIDTNTSKTLGAVEFGSEANSIFTPRPIAGNEAFMKGELDRLVRADNGGTNYNAGFNQANTENPGADGRIFLTDG